jgi:hypothetical protein
MRACISARSLVTVSRTRTKAAVCAVTATATAVTPGRQLGGLEKQGHYAWLRLMVTLWQFK